MQQKQELGPREQERGMCMRIEEGSEFDRQSILKADFADSNRHFLLQPVIIKLYFGIPQECNFVKHPKQHLNHCGALPHEIE